MKLLPDLFEHTVEVASQNFAAIFLGIAILKQFVDQSGHDLIQGRRGNTLGSHLLGS